MPTRTAGRAAALALIAALAACGKPATNAPAAANSAAATAPASNAAAPAALAAGDGAAGAKAFLEGLYAHYKVDPTNSAWSPMDKNDAEVFDADTVRLLAADMKAAKGEVGAIDGDYICACQDWEPFTAAVVVTSATPTTAKASADFKVFKTDQPRHLEFDLVNQKGAWRIHDVRENDQTEQPPAPGLRETLQNELKSPSKPGAGAT